MQTQDGTYDVLIVGSGLMGAAVARLVREAEPQAAILMVDGGPRLGSQYGQHLHDVPERQIWERYNQHVASGIQGFYTGTTPSADVGSTITEAEPGMYHLSSIGEDAEDMPAAAVSWNLGGMGVHWTAATPTPWGTEIPEFIDDQEWANDLQEAARLLRVNPQPFPSAPAGEATLQVLHRLYDAVSAEGRAPQHMPMAIQFDEHGVRRRTGPNVIFEPIRGDRPDEQFTLLSGTQAVEVLHDGTRATGIRTRDVGSGEEREFHAHVTVVCADAIRTPQLLFASNIRPSALGRYLNEHAFLSGRVLVDTDRLGIPLHEIAPQEPGEFMTESLWIPHSGDAQPFHVQIANQVHVDDEDRPLAYSIGLAYYVPTQIQRQNRLEFSEQHTDAAGMPRITIRFSYTEEDERLIDRARQEQRKAAEAFGPFDPDTESALLPAGSSLHFTGTVRMGPRDDGTSVCDPHGRVWGFDNLYVAGNGVLPTVLASNSTFAGTTTAVRAARSVVQLLGSRSDRGASLV